MSDLFIEKDAFISECGNYRYLLRRCWDCDRMRALLVMLNPSTADAEVDDPTIKSCTRLLQHWGFGSFEVVNLYAWRATEPDDLLHADDPVGDPKNNAVIDGALNRCDIAICAWGAHQMAANGRGARLREMLSVAKPVAYCFGTTKDGHPKHPLYIKTGTPLTVYRGASEHRDA